jgi:hypothetical protein
VGAFSAAGHGDVVAIGSSRESHEFWFVPDLDQGEKTPVRLVDGLLDPSLSPVDESDLTGRLSLAGSSADLDGDGRDEALWAMPNNAGKCTLLSFGIDVRSAPKLIPHGSLELSEGCENPELSTADVDADGAPDILLLSGQHKAKDRKLSVLWNDGAGGFALSEMTQVSGARDVPEGFATLSRTTVRPFGIVYVTEQKAFLARALTGSRGLDPPVALTPQLSQGQGVTAADINGDGAEDLVFADGSKLTVLLAELKTP